MSRKPDAWLKSDRSGGDPFDAVVMYDASSRATQEPLFRQTAEDREVLELAVRVSERLCERYDNYAGVDVKELAAKLRAMIGEAK